MKLSHFGPGRMFMLLLALAGVAFLAALVNEHEKLFNDKYNEYLYYGANRAVEGCIAFGALYLYLPGKVSIEAFGHAWAEGLWKEGNDILVRAETAREAIDTLASVGSHTPSQLPIACTAEFSDVASFCAGWCARERRRYWDRPLAARLQEATRALFDFLLILDLKSPPNRDELNAKKVAAEKCLDAVLQMLRQTLKIPNP